MVVTKLTVSKHVVLRGSICCRFGDELRSARKLYTTWHIIVPRVVYSRPRKIATPVHEITIHHGIVAVATIEGGETCRLGSAKQHVHHCVSLLQIVIALQQAKSASNTCKLKVASRRISYVN